MQGREKTTYLFIENGLQNSPLATMVKLCENPDKIPHKTKTGLIRVLGL